MKKSDFNINTLLLILLGGLLLFALFRSDSGDTDSINVNTEVQTGVKQETSERNSLTDERDYNIDLYDLQSEPDSYTEDYWPAPDEISPSSSNCDSSYPDVCIPPSPPDLDCGDVAASHFLVLPPDPHRFDGDGDGVGCE